MEVIFILNQDMIIYRLIQPQDKDSILKGQNAYYDEYSCEILALNRACAVRELNRHGIRVLQFIVTPDSPIIGGWVLIEEE